MEFNLKEADIIKLIMVYLKEKGIYETLSSLALESNVSIGKADDTMLFLQKLILQGRWDNVIEYLIPVKELYPHLNDQIDYIVQRQKYLEMLSWQDGGLQRMAFPPWNPMLSLADKKLENNIEMNLILAQLNILKTLCSTIEFNALCAFLTLERLDEHPQYQGWTVSQGRYQCFIELRNIVCNILPGENDQEIPINNYSTNHKSDDMKKNGLLKLIAMALAYQTALATNRNFYDKNEPQNASYNDTLGYILPTDLIMDKMLTTNTDNSNNEDEDTPKIILVSPVEYLRKHDQKSIPYSGVIDHNNHNKIHEIAANMSTSNTVVNIITPAIDPLSHINNDIDNKSSLPLHPYHSQQQLPNPPQSIGLPYISTAAVEVPIIPSSRDNRNVINPPIAPVTNPTRLSIEVEDSNKQQYNSNQIAYSTSNKSSHAYNSLGNGSFTPHSQMNTHHINEYNMKVPVNNQLPNEVDIAHSSSKQSDGMNQISSVPKMSVAPAIAWTLDVNELVANSVVVTNTIQEQNHKELIKRDNNSHVEIASTAFIVGIEDTNKLKPMPIALRKKMMGDQNSSTNMTIVEENHNKEIENHSKRGSSNIRSSRSSIESGSATGSGRPQSQSAIRTSKSIKMMNPSNDSSNNDNEDMSRRRSVSSEGVRRINSQNPVLLNNYNDHQLKQTVIDVHDREKTPSYLNNNNINPMHPTTSNTNEEYSSYLLYQSNCPIRCVSILNNNNNITRIESNTKNSSIVELALGSNAKSIHILSYNKEKVMNNKLFNSVNHNHENLPDNITMKYEFKNIHKGSVYTMDWNEDLGLLVSGSNDKNLRLSNPRNEEVSEYLKGHNGTIRIAKFLKSTNNNQIDSSIAYIASAGAGDFMPRLWDVQTGSCIRTLSEHPDAIHGLVWINENIILTGCDHGQIIGHDLRSSKSSWIYNLNHLLNHSSNHAGDQTTTATNSVRRGICCLSMCDRKFDHVYDYTKDIPIIAGCSGGYVTIFDPIKGTIYSHNKLHTDDVRSINTMPLLSANNHTSNLLSPRFDDGLSFRLLTSSYDGTSVLWNILSNKAKEFKFYGKPNILKGGHTDKVLQAIPIVSYNNKVTKENEAINTDIISTGADGKTILWSTSK